MDRRADFDAYAPAQIAERVQTIGATKARLPFLQMARLGVLAGGFTGLGSLYYVRHRAPQPVRK